MRPHKIRIDNKDEIVLYSSVECKGIIGNDSRYYILDLLRMSPPDLNYASSTKHKQITVRYNFYYSNLFRTCVVEASKLDAELQKLSFPRKFRHKLCCLRPELIELFVEYDIE